MRTLCNCATAYELAGKKGDSFLVMVEVPTINGNCAHCGYIAYKEYHGKTRKIINEEKLHSFGTRSRVNKPQKLRVNSWHKIDKE